MTDQERIFAVCVISASWFKFLDDKEGMHMKKVNGRQLTNPSERTTEMKPNKICKRSFIMAMALAAVFALAAAWPRTASAVGPAECSLIGTWYGDAGYSLKWLGVQTAGSTPTQGEMVLNWLRVSPRLLPLSATSMTGGRGVWEMTARNEYKYTWYAYGMGAGLDPVFSVRVSGTARMMAIESESLNLSACDFVLIDFTYEVFGGFLNPLEMSGATPSETITSEEDGPAFEMRVPLTVVTPTP